MKPDDRAIDDVLNLASDAEEEGTTKYPGMTYEQGVGAAIRWMRGNEPAPPLGEE